MKKDTIYIDIEDDITAIIDKVKASKAKIVALVPPKRSTALNSAVNMKLLTRAATEANKKLVLVTSESSLVSLAGGVGMYVTNNLHSKPYVPETTQSPLDDDVVIDGNEIDPSTPVGELAGVQAATATAAPGKKPAKADKGKGAKKGFGLKIPSFERFRSRLFLIIGGILLLIVGWWWAFWLAPKATIAIQAQTSKIDTEFEFTIDTSAETDDYEKNIFEAEEVTITRTVTEDFEPTGTKDVGEKASGTITVRNCDYPEGFTVSSGTIFAANGLEFETLEPIVVQPFDGPASTCDLDGSEAGEGSANVRAIKPGDQYNLAPRSYSFATNNPGGNIDAVGGQMSGGTSEEVKVVAQSDINKARNRLEDADRSNVLDELKNQVEEDVITIDETFSVELDDISSQPKAGDEATSATLTANASFNILTIPRETLLKAVEDFQQAALEGGDQRIYENGMDNLVFSVLEQEGSKTEIRLSTNGYIGPELDPAQLAEAVSGQRYSQVVETLKSRPGVIDVEVEFSPFWVFSAPRPDKITINFDIQDTAPQQNEDG